MNDDHQADCVRVAGSIGCSCGAIQRRLMEDYFRKIAAEPPQNFISLKGETLTVYIETCRWGVNVDGSPALYFMAAEGSYRISVSAGLESLRANRVWVGPADDQIGKLVTHDGVRHIKNGDEK